MEVYPLSVPKGQKLACELCGKNATLRCPACGCTYYCGPEHKTADWRSIHHLLCELVAPLRQPEELLGSEEERRRRAVWIDETRREALEISSAEAHRLVQEGDFDRATPAAMQSLRYALQLFGSGTKELVPSYLLLGEASIGMERFQQAEEYLSLAKWVVLKSEDCSDELFSQLYRTLGILHSAKGELEAACAHLANDIYYSARAFGPRSLPTSGGFYHMGLCFEAKQDTENATAFFDMVLAVWEGYLRAALVAASLADDGDDRSGGMVVDPSAVLEVLGEAGAANGDSSGLGAAGAAGEFLPDEIYELSQAEIAEGVTMLRTILRFKEETVGRYHTSYGDAAYTLALLAHYNSDYASAASYSETAHQLYETALGLDNPKTVEIRMLLEAALDLSGAPPRANPDDDPGSA